MSQGVGGGRGNKFTYYLSETGSRYLEDHKDELIEMAEPEQRKEVGAVPTGVHHTVPTPPEWKGPSMPGTKEHEVQSKLQRPERTGRLPRDIEAAVDLGVAIAEHVATNGGVPVDDTQHLPKTDFAVHLRAVVGDLLMSKYADEISVKELLDYVEETD